MPKFRSAVLMCLFFLVLPKYEEKIVLFLLSPIMRTGRGQILQGKMV